MKDEAHISAQQIKTKKNPWIPGSDENSRRTEGHQTPPSSGTQKACSLKFPKHLRLKNRREFLLLQKTGQRLVGKFICLDYRLAEWELPKLGITASSRYGDAPERNRFKRLAREAFRASFHDLPPNIELNIVPRQRAKCASAEQIRIELVGLVKGKVHAEPQPG
jgi:ribonuclease P protein component